MSYPARLFACLLLCLPQISQSNEFDDDLQGPDTEAAAPPADIDGPPEPNLMEKSLRFAVSARQLLSEQVVSISDSLDSFIGSERASDEINGSHIRLRQSAIVYEDGRVGQLLTSNFKLDLPRTNQRLSLVIESDSQADETTATSDSEVEIPANTATAAEDQQTAITSTIQYVLKRSDDWHVRAHAGIRLDGTDLDPLSKLRIRRLFVSAPWEYRLTETLFWYLSEGHGETSQLDIERPVVSGLFFRATNKATWREVTDYFDLSQTLTLYHTIGPRQLLSYQAGAYGISEPQTHVTTYVLGATYRQLLYQNWLFMDIAPAVVYPESNNFTATPSITLSIEVLFGKD